MDDLHDDRVKVIEDKWYPVCAGLAAAARLDTPLENLPEVSQQEWQGHDPRDLQSPRMVIVEQQLHSGSHI